MEASQERDRIVKHGDNKHTKISMSCVKGDIESPEKPISYQRSDK